VWEGKSLVAVLKDIPIPGVEVIPCRLTGRRGVVKAFVLHDDQSTVLVDTGFSDADADIIVERLAKVGRSPSDMTMCIITHRHIDHVGGLKKLRSLAEFPVIAHELEAADVQDRAGVKVDRVIRDGDELPANGGIRIVHMPGHTPGNVALFVPRVRALVAADSLFSTGEHLIFPPQFLCHDPEEAKESARRLVGMGLPIETVLVGHGEDVYGSAQGALKRMLLEKELAASWAW
jgi:glyoxylase-like metal-dependent hydrolase (beta-lactamase superfamily II)